MLGREVARLDRFVTDLLMHARTQAGAVVHTELGALVTERVELLRPWAAARGVAIQSSGRAAADLEPDSVGRAIDNLIRNAVEASPAGARVDVIVAARGERVEVAVLDDGPGVSTGEVARIFEPFFTTKPNGTGLGLSLCRAVARIHGGELAYNREMNKTRFSLRLPRG